MNYDYNKQARNFLKKTETTFSATFLKHDKYFPDDKEARDIYQITLKRKNEVYSFTFGQSIADSREGISPRPYDVLACLTKYDPENFENFCAEYGYDTDSRKAEKIYEAVQKEYDNVISLFDDSIEELREIN